MVGAAGSNIRVGSLAQAEEWSLVLLSQGIESAIVPPEQETPGAGGGWQIQIPSAHFGRAARILRQYKVENRMRALLPDRGRKLVFDWGNSWFFVLLGVVFGLSELPGSTLRTWGLMDRTAFLSGDWWRPLTAVLLHHDLPHLFSNMGIGLVFLGLAGGLFGTGLAILISFSAGALANIIGCLFHPGRYLALGSSGLVMGALGLLTSDAFFHSGTVGFPVRWAFRGIAAGLLLLVLLGFDPHPQTDVLAHILGFLIGLGLGVVSELISNPSSRSVPSAPNPPP